MLHTFHCCWETLEELEGSWCWAPMTACALVESACPFAEIAAVCLQACHSAHYMSATSIRPHLKGHEPRHIVGVDMDHRSLQTTAQRIAVTCFSTGQCLRQCGQL